MDVIRKDMCHWGPKKGMGKNIVTIEYEELSGLGEYEEFDLRICGEWGWGKASFQRAVSTGRRLSDVLEVRS